MRISDWSSDVCSSDLYEYVGENVSYFSTLSAASNAARQVGAHGRGFDGTFSSADLEQLKQVDGGHYLVNVDHPLVLPVGKKIRSSEERRVGKEFVSTCRSRCSPFL